MRQARKKQGSKMVSRAPSRATRLKHDDRGASIVELALVMPLLASLLVGMVDLSRAYSHKLKLEQSAQRAIEKVRQYQSTSSSFSALQDEAAAAAGVPPKNVAIDYWLECNGVRAASYESVCAEGQPYARWVQVDVAGTFTPLFPSKRYPGANKNGTFTLRGIERMRTQ